MALGYDAVESERTVYEALLSLADSSNYATISASLGVDLVLATLVLVRVKPALAELVLSGQFGRELPLQTAL